MTMDYLDEATIEVKQHPHEAKASADGGAHVALDGAAALKNQAQNVLDLQGFSFHDNNLLNAGAELLSLCVGVTRMQRPEDLHRFRQGLTRSITELKQRIAAYDYPPSVADKTCFLFCIVLDELILHSEWAEDSGWENQTLVGELFGMRDGGEQFYIVAEKALSQPNMLADLLELIYIFIKIGFRGQYRQVGRDHLDQLIQQIETVVFRTRPTVPFQLTTKVQQPKAVKPGKQARFALQMLTFVAGIVLAWGATSYWYTSSFEQRAREFMTLAEFSDTYLNVADEEEVVYVSTVEEMQRAARFYGTPEKPTKLSEPAPAAPAQEPTEPSANTSQSKGRWQVQLATVNEAKQGDAFIERYGLQGLGAIVEPWKSQYRVLIIAADRPQARSVVEQVRSKGISDAFFIFSNQQNR